jgi:hypothetical protein
MATKSNFTSEEWGKLLASPMVAGMAITAADPSGLWGLLKEGMAGGWALLEARQNTQANQLVNLPRRTSQRLKGVQPRERRWMQGSRTRSLTGSKTMRSPN